MKHSLAVCIGQRICDGTEDTYTFTLGQVPSNGKSLLQALAGNIFTDDVMF